MKLKYRVIERFCGKYPIGSMCRLFEVSRSGCYAWRKRQGKPEKDQWLVDLIIDCQQRSIVHFYRNVFSVVPKSKVKIAAKMLKAIHAQESKKASREKRVQLRDFVISEISA